MAAVGEDGSDDKKKVAIVLTVAGAQAQEVFRTFMYEPAKAAVGDQPTILAETTDQYNSREKVHRVLRAVKKHHIREVCVSHMSTR